MYLRESNICPHQLDVQEANVSIPQFCRIRNHFVGCWTANGWCTCSRFRDVVIEVLRSTNKTKPPTNPAASANGCETGDCLQNTPKPNKRETVPNVDHVSTDAPFSQGESRLYIFEGNDAAIKMIKRQMSNRETHVKNPQSCD